MTRGATKIMLIRHAEKPQTSPLVHGVKSTGDHHRESLAVRGWQRAGALACLLSGAHGTPGSSGLAVPSHIYAAKAHTSCRSKRPIETVGPLAEKLGLEVDHRFAKGHEQLLVEEARNRGGSVLISWHHMELPAIANLITGNEATTPQTWPENRFDVIWVFNLAPRSGRYRFSQVPQMLLGGDSPELIS